MADRQPGEVPGDATPETYLGTARAQGWVPNPFSGVRDYPGVKSLPVDRFAYGGVWRVSDESAEAVGHLIDMVGPRSARAWVGRWSTRCASGT